MEPPSPPYTPDPVLAPALKVGAVTGSSGFIAGGVIGVLRSSPTPRLFAVGTGLNCFALGSTYWAARSIAFRLLQDPYAPHTFLPREKVYVSGASGALTGFSLGLLLRGRSNAIPGAIVWGLMGLGGQYAYNIADARHTQDVARQAQPADAEQGFWARALRSKWSPVKRLTDTEYEAMLKGRILAVEADIAVTDEEIEKLEQEKQKQLRESPGNE